MQPPDYKSDMKGYILVDEKAVVKGQGEEEKASEIAIWVDGRAAGRISRQALLDASPIFRDKFAGNIPSGPEVHLTNISDSDLLIFLDVLMNEPIPLVSATFRKAEPIISALRRYKCNEGAKSLLYQSVEFVGNEELFDAFALASQMDDLRSGLRILTQGHRWYAAKVKPSNLSLCPGSEQRPWKAKHAQQIEPSWLWALGLASETCRFRAGAVLQAESFWKGLAGEFVGNLHR